MTLTIDYKSLKKNNINIWGICPVAPVVTFSYVTLKQSKYHIYTAYSLHGKASHLTKTLKCIPPSHPLDLVSWKEQLINKIRWSVPGSFKVSMLVAHILEKTTWIMLLNRDHHLDINVLIGFMKVVCKDILSRLFLSSRGASPPLVLCSQLPSRYIHPRLRGCHVHHNQSVLYLKSSGRNWPLPDIWVLANATPR